MLSPDEISGRRFLVGLRGYDRDEVASFLQEVAGDFRQLRTRVAELEAQLARAQEAASGDGVDARSAFQALGQETTRILVAAEESARDIETKAAAAAQTTRDEAQREARETTDRANRQAARTIAEAERRRDAIAAEIADLKGERDRFVEGLRRSVASIGGVVGGLSEEEARAEAAEVAGAAAEGAAPTAPTELTPPDETTEGDVVVAGHVDAGEWEQSDEPVVLDHDGEEEPAAEVVAEPPPVEEASPEVAADAAESAPADTADHAEPEPEPEPEPAQPTVESRRDERLEELRTTMARQCKRGLQEVQNEVLASIRDHGRGAALDDLLPGEAELDDLGANGTVHLAGAYNGALEDAAAEVDGDAPESLVDGARVQAAVATFRAVLAHEVTSALRATLRAGLEADEPEPQLSERVGEVFRDLRGPVIEAAVDEHLQRTYGHGLLDAWQQLGVEQVAWVARDEARCPEGRCRTNASEGPVAIGTDFPSGDRVPPAHPGCTCVVEPAGE